MASELSKTFARSAASGSEWIIGSDALLICNPHPGLSPAIQCALKHNIPIVAAEGKAARSMVGAADYVIAQGTQAEDFAEAIARTGRQTQFKPSAASPAAQYRKMQSVTIASPFMVYDGYGSIGEYLACGMARAGAKVAVAPIHLDLAGTLPEFQQIVQNSQVDPDAPVIFHCWPNDHIVQYEQAENLFAYTMWESSWLPQGWTEKLNKARAIITPSRFAAQVMRESGVTVPIEVIAEGYDPDVYRYETRPARAGITTLLVGTMIERKNTREAVLAWKQAFANDPEARLIIKARFQYKNYIPDDPRITFVDTNETTRGIAHWYREADVLLALGSEGFGLPLVEGMATGLPVIALDAEGQADVCQEARDCVLPVEPMGWRACYERQYGGYCGVRAIPNVDRVAEHLRWVAEHRQEANSLGKAASEWVRKHRNIWTLGPNVLDMMERRVEPPRPLRRVPTLWVPSWQERCGISEYSAYLTEHLPRAAVAKQAPNPSGASVVHIQHENSFFDDEQLTAYIEDAHHYGVPVAITEHTVTAETRTWEQNADLLLAMTQRGTRMLRQRHPAKRVEYIPHGCPTWFPKRKLSRGRVIGAFGFLEWYKGFMPLLEVLREVPDTELLLYSRAKTPQAAQRWEAAIHGLRVRWVREYLPVDVVAARLAAEADMLAFWYQGQDIAAASGAVRVGLATGVPVLASPTSWFEDLREVTFQPDHLADGVRRLLEDTELREELTGAARDYCHANSWARNARRHSELWQTLGA